MSRKITDVFLRNLKASDEIQKIQIGEGLSLWVRPTGKKTWYLRYYVGGKRQIVTIGQYPALSLKDATRKAEDLKELAKTEGVNLGQDIKRQRRLKVEQANADASESERIFMSVAEKWLEKKALTWVPGHLKRQRERLQGHIYSAFGNKDVNEITMADIDSAMHPLVVDGKNETAKRACDLVRNVLEHADLMEQLENSSIISKIAKYRRAIPSAPVQRNFYREMDENQIGTLLLALEESKLRWSKTTSVASRLAPYVFLRASELCGAQWAEINLDTGEWLIPAERMKSRREHLVPLSRQAISLLEEIKPLTGGSEFVFPSQSKPKQPITTNAIIQILRRLGYKSTQSEGDTFVTHAFRGLASTTLYQKLKYPGDYIELQLAHIEPNKVKAAYNQIGTRSYIEERREMMQKYADYLDTLREQAKNSQ